MKAGKCIAWVGMAAVFGCAALELMQSLEAFGVAPETRKAEVANEDRITLLERSIRIRDLSE